MCVTWKAMIVGPDGVNLFSRCPLESFSGTQSVYISSGAGEQCPDGVDVQAAEVQTAGDAAGEAQQHITGANASRVGGQAKDDGGPDPVDTH